MADPEIIAAILTSGMVPPYPDVVARAEYSLGEEQINEEIKRTAEDAVRLYRAVLEALSGEQ